MSKSAKLGQMVRVKNKREKSFSHEADEYLVVHVRTEDGSIKTLMFTDGEIYRSQNRATRNPEDQPKLHWWSKIFG